MAATSNVIRWNTGRKYSAEGQLITATIANGLVVFHDKTRGILGGFQGELSEASVMAAYDCGAYSYPACLPLETRQLLGLNY